MLWAFPLHPLPERQGKDEILYPCCHLCHTLQRKLTGRDSGVIALNRMPAKKNILHMFFLFFGTWVGGLCEQWYWCSLAQGLLFTFAVPMACTYVRPPWHKIGLYPLSLSVIVLPPPPHSVVLAAIAVLDVIVCQLTGCDCLLACRLCRLAYG